MSPALTHAQSDDIGPDPGDWALQFQINENFTLSSFQGSAVSVKRQLSEQSALRLGTSIFASSRSFDDDTRSQQRVTINAQWLYTPIQEADVIRPYVGAGPQVLFRRAKEEDINATSTDQTYGGGVTGVLGAEWFVHSSIGISAEYRLAATFERRTYERTRSGETVSSWPTVDELRLGSESVLVGVSVYF